MATPSALSGFPPAPLPPLPQRQTAPPDPPDALAPAAASLCLLLPMLSAMRFPLAAACSLRRFLWWQQPEDLRGGDATACRPAASPPARPSARLASSAPAVASRWRSSRSHHRRCFRSQRCCDGFDYRFHCRFSRLGHQGNGFCHADRRSHCRTGQAGFHGCWRCSRHRFCHWVRHRCNRG